MKRKFHIWLILSILWLCVIWGHSMMPASVSNRESGGLFRWLVEILPWLTHGLLRKIAHFSAFAVLGGLLSGTFWYAGRKLWLWPIGCALCCAFADETIQLFVTGRSGQISDMWIDLGGAVVGSLIVGSLFRYFAKKSR